MKVKLPVSSISKKQVHLQTNLNLKKASFGNRRTIAINKLNHKYMETLVVTIKGVRVYVNEDSASVTLTIGENVKGFKKANDGTFEEADVNILSFPRSALTAQLCDHSDDIAMYRATLDHAFGQKEFGVILYNAKLKINRELKAAGEVVNDKALERDCYLTTIVGVQLSDRAIRALDNAIAL